MIAVAVAVTVTVAVMVAVTATAAATATVTTKVMVLQQSRVFLRRAWEDKGTGFYPAKDARARRDN